MEILIIISVIHAFKEKYSVLTLFSHIISELFMAEDIGSSLFDITRL